MTHVDFTKMIENKCNNYQDMAAEQHNQAVLHTVADVEIPAAGIQAEQLLENRTVLADNTVLAGVDMPQVDILAEGHNQLQNQALVEQHYRIDLGMTQMGVPIHMEEDQSRRDNLDTWRHSTSTMLDAANPNDTT